MYRGTEPSRLRRSRVRRTRRSLLRFERLESREMLTVSSLVYPGPDGHLIYVPNAQGDVIPNFSMVGYMTGDVPLPDTAGGVSVPVKITINPGAGR